MTARVVSALLLSFTLFACSDDEAEGGDGALVGCDVSVSPSADDQTAVQDAFIGATPGQTVCLNAGTYRFTDELSLTTDGITIRGAGIDRTVLDFSGQTSGGNGIAVSDVIAFTAEAFTIKDAPGDGIRVTNSADVVFRKLKVYWSGGSATENGAYAIYPVSSIDVLVEDCETSGASDAGIYVGQTTRAVVRNNYVHGNVAGIEIENTVDSEVYGNRVEGNTGGVLVFNLPDLPMKDGRRALVRDNTIVGNNVPNFAPPGNIVAVVPKGTGILVIAADETEIRGNTIRDNASIGVAIVGWSTAEALSGRTTMDEEYDKFAETTYIHSNTWGGNGQDPEELLAGLGAVADIIWDADVDESKPNPDGALDLCIREQGITFRHVFENVTDLTPHDCEHAPVPGVTLP